MASFVIATPPDSFDDESKRYLDEMQQKINKALGAVNRIPPRTEVPLRPQNGHIYYFTRAILPITVPGIWAYQSNKWSLMTSPQEVQDE